MHWNMKTPLIASSSLQGKLQTSSTVEGVQQAMSPAGSIETGIFAGEKSISSSYQTFSSSTTTGTSGVIESSGGIESFGLTESSDKNESEVKTSVKKTAIKDS